MSRAPEWSWEYQGMPLAIAPRPDLHLVLLCYPIAPGGRPLCYVSRYLSPDAALVLAEQAWTSARSGQPFAAGRAGARLSELERIDLARGLVAATRWLHKQAVVRVELWDEVIGARRGNVIPFPEGGAPHANHEI